MNAGPAADLARLVDLVESFSRQKILVLGDFVADEFVFGEISRVSREAPVLILRHRETQSVPGGGANAANNLADLGARVRPVSGAGRRRRRGRVGRIFPVQARGHFRLGARARLAHADQDALSRWLDAHRQATGAAHGLRARGAFSRIARRTRWRAKRETAWRDASAMLVSDYGYGSATPAILRAIRGQKNWTLPVALDSRYRLHEYAGLGLAAATPNEAEIESAHHAQIGGGLARLESLARRTMTRLGVRALVVTRGRDGMIVFERGRAPRSLTVFGSDQAVDVTGAGDTVIAVFTLAIAAGGSAIEAAQLANYAGGIVVMKRGTATVTREELLGAIRADATGTPPVGEHA